MSETGFLNKPLAQDGPRIRLAIGVMAVLLAVLSFPNLLPLRYVLLVLLAGGMLAGGARALGQGFAGVNAVFVAWALFLLLFPLIPGNMPGAFQSLRGQWWPPLLALALTLLMGRQTNSLDSGGRLALLFGLGSAIPLCLHVLMALSVWAGLLPAIPTEHWTPPALSSGKILTFEAFPWGYWGVHFHHADIGYAALQSVVLLMAASLGNPTWRRPWLWLLILICLISPLIAHSRAGEVFAVLGMIVPLALWKWRSGWRVYWRHVAIGASVMAVAALLISAVLQLDSRWLGLADRLQAGFVGDPQILFCEGPEAFANDLRRHHPEFAEKDIAAIVGSVNGGDGSRPQLLRMGLRLLMEHPLGIDGSKQSYQKALALHCPQPAFAMAHVHNGWIDTALALGWLGPALYFLLLAHCCRTGWSALRQNPLQPTWPLVLASLSGLWILRGFFDSVYRDHMLWMQALTLGFAYSRVKMVSADRLAA